MITVHVLPAELDTVLAALRFYQEKGRGHADCRSLPIDAIATDSGEALDDEAIDALCERINTTDSEPHPFQAFVEQVAGTFRPEFDTEDDINGGDCVEEMSELVDAARALLGQPSIAEAVEANEEAEDTEFNIILPANCQEVDTILAALAFYLDKGQGEPENRDDDIHALASSFGVSLDGGGIEALRKRIVRRRTNADGIAVCREELDTINAALLVYSVGEQFDPEWRYPEIQRIAAGSGDALDTDGFDALSDRVTAVVAMLEAGDARNEG